MSTTYRNAMMVIKIQYYCLSPFQTHMSTIQKPLIGSSDFDKILSKNILVVDKTLFIKEFIENASEVNCILRPRRFGKSTNLSMLKSFFSLGAQPDSFSHYLIGKETDIVKQHCGKYPVVYLNLKDCKGDSWQDMYEQLWISLCEMVNRHQSDLTDDEIKNYKFGNDAPKRSALVSNILNWLMCELHKKYKKKVIVLIDEYDAPLNNAFNNGFYVEASKFFGLFYSRALKQDGNSTLEKACLMGIVEAIGAGILSGLNNTSVFSVAQDIYSSFFGFTVEEISSCFALKPNDFAEVLEWYNGYTFGSNKVINPWSFMNWFSQGVLAPYWITSAYMETLSSLLSNHVKNILIPIFCIMYDEQASYPVSPLVTKVNYSKTDWTATHILHFLIHAGYLTYNTTTKCVSIPNKEIYEIWETEVRSLLDTSYNQQYQYSIRESLEVFNVGAIENVMREMILSCSSFDVPSENSYHMFFYGCFFCILNSFDNTVVSSNKEAGHGRYDIRIEFRDLKRAVVFEFKKSKTSSTLDFDAQKGMNQLLELNYAADLGEYQCLLIGVAFYKKIMSKIVYQIIDTRNNTQ